MITDNISLILYVTGAITAGMIIQFVFPRLVLEKILKLKVEGDVTDFYARHWGVLVFVTGALLCYAGFDPLVRTPILIGAIIEKAALVLLVLANYKKGFLRSFALMAGFDSLCVIAYLLYLLGLA